MPNGMITINLNLLYVKGRSDLVLRMEIIKKTIMFGVLFVSMFWGLKAICFGLVLNNLIDLFFSSYYTKRILGYSLVQQLKAVSPCFMLSLVVLFEAIIVVMFVNNNLIALILAFILCAIPYGLASKFSGLYAYQETVALIRSKFRLQ